MSAGNSSSRNAHWWRGFILALLASIGCYLAVRVLPASSLVAQVGLGFLSMSSLVGFVQLFTVTIPWFIKANRSSKSSTNPNS